MHNQSKTGSSVLCSSEAAGDKWAEVETGQNTKLDLKAKKTKNQLKRDQITIIKLFNLPARKTSLEDTIQTLKGR